MLRFTLILWTCMKWANREQNLRLMASRRRVHPRSLKVLRWVFRPLKKEMINQEIHPFCSSRTLCLQTTISMLLKNLKKNTASGILFTQWPSDTMTNWTVKWCMKFPNFLMVWIYIFLSKHQLVQFSLVLLLTFSRPRPWILSLCLSSKIHHSLRNVKDLKLETCKKNR